MKIYPTMFKPSVLNNGAFTSSASSEEKYISEYATWLLSCIDANMELSESAEEIANAMRRSFSDISVTREKPGLYSFSNQLGSRIWIVENEAGEILMSTGCPVKETEMPIDITELGPEVASAYLRSVLNSGKLYQLLSTI